MKKILFTIFTSIQSIFIFGQTVSIQNYIDSNMVNLIKVHNGKDATCVVLETKTGNINFISSYNTNKKGLFRDSSLIYQQNEDKGLFKLISLWYLLEQHKVPLNQSVNIINGVTYVNKIKIRDSYQYTGSISLQESFTHSSDVGFVQFYKKYLKNDSGLFISKLNTQFKLNEPVNLKGYGLNNFKENKLDKNNTILYSFGKGIKTDALHFLMYYNAIANDGKMIIPNTTGETEILYQLDTETLKSLQMSLNEVVRNGTASNLKDENGASELSLKTSTNGDHSSFSMCGFFPKSNPKYTMIILFHSKEGIQGYSSNLLGYTFKSIAEKLESQY
jgi:cell division protein FtsI (penicillin-binding protein 3)